MINTILFDLDGTLLPMDQDRFIKIYGEELYKKLVVKFADKARDILMVIMSGIKVMYANDGTKTNEDLFWSYFEETTNLKKELFIEFMFDFYNNEFLEIAKACTPNEKAVQCIEILKNKGYKLVLATNPFFPKVATNNRVKIAGLCPSDFTLITTYENSCFCKPNLEYYKEVLTKINSNFNECLMVGNDVLEDGIIENLGIPCFLITDCLINSKNLEISTSYTGDFDEFINFVNKLPNIK